MSQPKPNLITRAAMKLPFIGGYITRAVQNRYEAAIQWFGDRSFLLQTLKSIIQNMTFLLDIIKPF